MIEREVVMAKVKVLNLLAAFISVTILVSAAGAAEKVPRIYAEMVKAENPRAACGEEVMFVGQINVQGTDPRNPVEVQYKWIRSDNANTPVKTLTVTKPGRNEVKTSWKIKKSYKGWQQLEVISPVSALSKQAHFTMTCP